jgi:predicted CoA-substrate-specific enzyme activase
MKNYFLGLDIGSVSISIALINDRGQIIHTNYDFHRGQIKEKLSGFLRDINLNEIKGLAYTSSTPPIIKNGLPIDSRIAYISAAKHFYPEIQSLLIIGAEKFGLATFNQNGEYRNYKSNSSCAAGTGNFLDQQAERLNLNDILEFSRLAYENKGGFPKIASRCAVFAKTDLIHAQQEGYSVGEICDGLSYGLAKNIVDTVFHYNDASANIIAAGGVALNKSVIDHIEKLTRLKISTDSYSHVYAAIGAALGAKDERPDLNRLINSIDDIVVSIKMEKDYYYPPLTLKWSEYPDFDAHQRYEYISTLFPSIKAVEVDGYSQKLKKNEQKVFLGIDIGSTSTKAVLIDENKQVLAGFYTRTSGQPLQAVQVIFECISDFAEKRNTHLEILGAGTTGSGRKFIGKIVGADMILDEITAHAKAAFELNPETDTIIEIGGQDSKFTIIRNGMVTFSIMNNVCAAGTGSFIEEQAKRLGCPLEDYAFRTEKVKSPIASDRCTVFMERDLNHYLMAGYSTDEILASVLHSTRENYLTKVASKGYIGNKICFQGATAKNKALVAAFEQKLKKPIMVSRYCHLTGALGVAFELFDNQIKNSDFRGLDLYKNSIPVRTEVCELCTNHCKLKVAVVENHYEAYGFLCGRDYQTEKYVKNQSMEFRLMDKRKELYKFKASKNMKQLTIGIPSALHLFEETLFWQKFFDRLSIKTITSEKYSKAVKDGKNLSAAEFCAPMAALHGHVNYLKDKVDFIFLPVYLKESLGTKMNDQYCYYTQFSSSVITTQSAFKPHDKFLTPLMKFSQNELTVRLELHRMLIKAGLPDISFNSLSQAYQEARDFTESVDKKWKEIYLNETKDQDDIHIILLGRPYTVLSPIMNNNIPEIIEKMGVKTFYMDMLTSKNTDFSKAKDLIKTLKWKFGSKILEATENVAKTENCYPVLISSFKCSPDSFVVEYFKEILDAYQKPYLILQLDEHDSTVGYETRIEAGIRAFHNHQASKKPTDSVEINGRVQKVRPDQFYGNDSKKKWNHHINYLVEEASQILQSHSIDFKLFSNKIQQLETQENYVSNSILKGSNHLKNKTLLLPLWDHYIGPLLEAVLQNSGINAFSVNSTNESIQRSLSYNTGQCLPLNITVQNAIDFIQSKRLNPAETALWITKSKLSCNLTMFPYYMKKLLNDYGEGMEQSTVYIGDVSFYDFSLNTSINAYLAYMFGGYIRKIACSIRPYEKNIGETEEVVNKALKMSYDAFLNGVAKVPVLENIIHEFEAIQTEKTDRPKVAIFGDLYVRDNDLFNQDLVKFVEENGGEVITTPYSEYIKIIVDPHTERSLKERNYFDYVKVKFLGSLIPLVEDKYNKYLKPYKGESTQKSSEQVDEWLDKFGLNVLHRGESIENILKIYSLINKYPDLDLFIQTNPSYCCPSLITEAMTARIEEVTGIPVVSIEYDGTMGFKNEDVIPYLKYKRKRSRFQDSYN